MQKEPKKLSRQQTEPFIHYCKTFGIELTEELAKEIAGIIYESSKGMFAATAHHFKGSEELLDGYDYGREFTDFWSIHDTWDSVMESVKHNHHLYQPDYTPEEVWEIESELGKWVFKLSDGRYLKTQLLTADGG